MGRWRKNNIPRDKRCSRDMIIDIIYWNIWLEKNKML